MNALLLPSVAVATFVLGTHAYAAAVATPLEERVTRTAAGRVTDHAADELRDPAAFEFVRRKPGDVATKSRITAADKGFGSLKTTYGDSWVYDASTDLFSDHDGDGYFHYLRVRFDVDSIYASSFVYAEIYLSADGVAWEHLYSTQDFEIWGSDPDDDYEVETDLVSGYSTGLYDVLIEIYDADTGELVDEFGPNESPEFSILPLEDSERDGHVVAPPPVEQVYLEGGGAVSWFTLSGLLGALLWRRRRPS
jgi:hypothetical protein